MYPECRERHSNFDLKNSDATNLNINKFLTIHDRKLSQGKIKRQMKIGEKLSNIYHIGLVFLICKELLHLKWETKVLLKCIKH